MADDEEDELRSAASAPAQRIEGVAGAGGAEPLETVGVGGLPNKDAKSEGGGTPRDGATASPSRRKRRPQGSYLDRIPGVRRVKEYPLSESELTELGMISRDVPYVFLERLRFSDLPSTSPKTSP
jgi:hypothetical protein